MRRRGYRGSAPAKVPQRPQGPGASVNPRAITETEFMSTVLEAARAFGWLAYHTHDSRRSAAGFPDLVLVRGERMVFAELKSARGRITPDQHVWLATLEGVNAPEVYCWRPSDWVEIESTLRRRGHE